MNKDQKKMKGYRRAANILYPITAMLLCLMIIANNLMWRNSDMVSQFLGQETSRKVSTTGEEVDTEYFKSDYTKLKQVQKDEKSYAQDVQAEGSVLLLNTMNAVSLGKYENDAQISILWVGAGGQQGLRAIPEILCGQRNPSGHLTATYAYDAYSAPAMVNFGNYQMAGELGAYVNYAEGIYVGYKYYETRYADAVTGRENVGEYDYADTV